MRPFSNQPIKLIETWFTHPFPPPVVSDFFLRCLRIGLTFCYLFFLLHYTPFVMLLMYKNVPVVTICWVTFFALCFLIFLVLSLCSESHCPCCRCWRCCREGTATVARIPSLVTTTYSSSRDSLHHSLMRFRDSEFSENCVLENFKVIL